MSLRVQELELENKTLIATNMELWKLEFKSWRLQTNTNSTKQEAQKTCVQKLELENKTQIAPNKELWKLEFKSGSLQTNTNNTKQGAPKPWVQEVKLGNKTQRTPKKKKELKKLLPHWYLPALCRGFTSLEPFRPWLQSTKGILYINYFQSVIVEFVLYRLTDKAFADLIYLWAFWFNCHFCARGLNNQDPPYFLP
jgi:hypothetical protein